MYFQFYLIFCLTTAAVAVARFSVMPPPAPRRTNLAPIARPPFEYREFQLGAPTYTIISHQTQKTRALVEELCRHQTNYVLIDMGYFSYVELVEIWRYYQRGRGCAAAELPPPEKLLSGALVFLEDREYIGGHFEMYEILFRKSI
jgi:hypothetical protein